MEDVFYQLERDGWELVTDDGFVGHVGPFVRRQEAQGLRFGFPTFSKHANHYGVLQGGALLTFADRALGFTVRHTTGATRTATIQLNVQFLDSVNIGEFVESRPVVSRTSKQIVFVNTALMVGEREIAIVQGIWKIRAADGMKGRVTPALT